jgi:hypothetical protein
MSEAAARAAMRGKQSYEREDTRAKMVICVNSNICGKPNPTNVPGYGFAMKAIDAIMVLGPPWLESRPGPCFVRCSRGVNARLVGSKKACAAAGVEPIRSRDLFRLNSVDDCVAMLAEELSWQVNDTLLESYRAYAEAVLLMDEVLASTEGASMTGRAATALPLLDVAANFALKQTMSAGVGPGLVGDESTPALTTFARVASAIAGARSDWVGSRWRESFYATEMEFVDGSFLGGGSVCGTYTHRTHSARTLHCMRAVSQCPHSPLHVCTRLYCGVWPVCGASSYGRHLRPAAVRHRPRRLIGRHGTHPPLELRAWPPQRCAQAELPCVTCGCQANGRELRGTWREELAERKQDVSNASNIEGEVALRMSADGLSFSGVVRAHGSHTGHALPTPCTLSSH